MAAFFLVLAAVVGVVVGDAVIANTGADTVTIFDQSITGFTKGQLLVIAAGLGFLFALFLSLAWGSSRNRRLKRRERREVRRDMEGRIDELERENMGLRDELDRERRTSRLGDMNDTESTQASRPLLRSRNRFDDGGRIEEPARPAALTQDSTAPRDRSEALGRERANNR